jgi:hypothetical protein
MEIPLDPQTGQPVEPFKSAIDRLFMAEDSQARFGQFEVEEISQLLERSTPTCSTWPRSSRRRPTTCSASS